MSTAAPDAIVFLLDVDNTLLDNDHIESDLRNHLEHEFGIESRGRYWAIFEALRAELGYADYLGALQRYRLGDLNDPRLLHMSSFLVDYPFAQRHYHGALDVISAGRYNSRARRRSGRLRFIHVVGRLTAENRRLQ